MTEGISQTFRHADVSNKVGMHHLHACYAVMIDPIINHHIRGSSLILVNIHTPTNCILETPGSPLPLQAILSIACVLSIHVYSQYLQEAMCTTCTVYQNIAGHNWLDQVCDGHLPVWPSHIQKFNYACHKYVTCI